jgi:hypothetical protein
MEEQSMDNPKALLQYHEIPRLKDKWRQMKGCTNSELGCLLGHIAGLEALLGAAEKRIASQSDAGAAGGR